MNDFPAQQSQIGDFPAGRIIDESGPTGRQSDEAQPMCDKPADGHHHHHCPECATHPNGGWAFSTWVDNPMIRPVDRRHESMHEYADVSDPWADESNRHGDS